MVSEGRKRGLSYNRIAELVSANPARRYGLHTKGAIEVGYDADFALLDDGADWVVRADESLSTQEYTPFEGFHMTARVTDTFVRGQQVLADGAVVGEPVGRFVHRSGAQRRAPLRRVSAAGAGERLPRTAHDREVDQASVRVGGDRPAGGLEAGEHVARLGDLRLARASAPR